MMNTPRLMLAAASSGCGKTTVACAILQALKVRGISCVSYKCGPDYIDPMFHRQVLGIASRNLDLFFVPEQTARFLLQKSSRGADLAFIEGVMGYYDGIASTSTASSWHLARATRTPAVLVLNCRGMSVSIAAQLGGYLNYERESGIRGVILNQPKPQPLPGDQGADREPLFGRGLRLHAQDAGLLAGEPAPRACDRTGDHRPAGAD